ncbi:MAG: hypothetical protein WD771_02710 [Gemmatimonadaceae bacterium]
MRRIAGLAVLVAVTAGCDRKPAADASAERVLTELAGATVLFQVFGPRETPRIAPVAVVRGETVERLALDGPGWREFDETIFAPGNRLPVYLGGAEVGTVEVTRGMWTADSAPVYTVVGCRQLVPHAIGRMEAQVVLEESIELLGTSAALVQKADPRPLPGNPETQGRTLAGAVAAAAGIGPEDLSALDFHARWLRTGYGESGRTLLASYIDPNAGDLGPGAGNTAVVLVMADDSAGVLQTSYQHALSGESRTVEFQRLLNYADLTGDGVAELIIEAWRYGGIPSLAILSRKPGGWSETFRVSLDWCADVRPAAQR